MRNLTPKSLDDFTENGKVLVQFHADWCGPCQKIKPEIEKLKSKYKKMKFAAINVSKYPELASLFGIISVPAVVLFKDGEIQNVLAVNLTISKLKKGIDKCLSDL